MNHTISSIEPDLVATIRIPPYILTRETRIQTIGLHLGPYVTLTGRRPRTKTLGHYSGWARKHHVGEDTLCR